ncbi:MAG: tyrosine--tRNA ligase [Alphaproteobacteria bacterium]|nr:tyrosine--tRNA ligase [Alphaproteobacteria bacterium]
MTTYRSDLLRIFQERGFIHQVTDPEGLDALAARREVVGYIGFDCTADSLHIGSLVQIMMLRWLQKTGQRAIALMGGGTTRVGDPSGRDESRKLLTDATIATNLEGIRRNFDPFLDFAGGDGDGARPAMMINNADWLDELRYIPFLRDIGRHFSVNRMLTMDSVRLRLERDQPLTFLEFNYMLLQSYDFVELAKRHGCNLQMGGSDQWGNIVMGVELGRRVADASLFGMTTPLITTASGQKMGKTAAGAIWLAPHRLAPYDYFQFWRNTEDADVGRFLGLFTDMPLGEIARLEALRGAEVNEAKKILAHEATRMLHGKDAADRAAETARQVFEQGAAGGELPTISRPWQELEAGIPLHRLVAEAGLAKSNSEARRLAEQGGIRLNDAPAPDPNRLVGLADIGPDGAIKLSAGRKRHALVRPT